MTDPNLLLSREPVHGVGEWAARFPPDLFGLRQEDLARLHDDRLGRCLDRLFEGIGPTVILAVVRRVVHGRAEDVAFRQRFRAAPSALTWTRWYRLTDDHGNRVDEMSNCGDDHVHSEGYRLRWYHSTRKADLDAASRARSIQRATASLDDLRDRLQGPRLTKAQREILRSNVLDDYIYGISIF